MTLKNIIDSFYSNNVDYNEIVNNKDVIIEGKDELIDNIKNPKKDSELTIYSLILLATINDKDSFLNILNLFKIDDLFKDEELIDGKVTFWNNYKVKFGIINIPKQLELSNDFKNKNNNEIKSEKILTLLNKDN